MVGREQAAGGSDADDAARGDGGGQDEEHDHDLNGAGLDLVPFVAQLLDDRRAARTVAGMVLPTISPPSGTSVRLSLDQPEDA